MHFLRTDIKEIRFLLLTILEPVSLILNWFQIDLNILLLGVAFINIKGSLVKFRLFDKSLLSKFLQVYTILIKQDRKV